MAAPEQSLPTATTGTAKRARDRKQRCLAKRVAWITGLYQSAASHHTAPAAASGISELCSRVAALEAIIATISGHTPQADLHGAQPVGHASHARVPTDDHVVLHSPDHAVDSSVGAAQKY